MTFPLFPTACLLQTTPQSRWDAFRKAIQPELDANTPPEITADFYIFHERHVRAWRKVAERKRHYR